MVETSTIPILYETLEDGSQGERAYLREIKAWLASQPQDSWLMVLKNMNWGSMGSLIEFMIDNPDCDIAVAAYIFWYCDPGWHVANEGTFSGDPRIARIAANVGRGFYRRSELALNRFEILHNVHTYAEAVRGRRLRREPARIALLRALLGPFVGREPAIAPGNAATERHLDEIIHAHGSSHLYRTQAAWREALEGNYWIRHYFTLPPLPSSSQQELHGLDEQVHIEVLYGATAAYMDARNQLSTDMPYLGKETPTSLFGQFLWNRRLKQGKGNRQFYEGV